MENFERNNQKPLDFNQYRDISKADGSNEKTININNAHILYPSPYMSDDSVEHSEPVSNFIKSMGYSVVNEDGETSKGKTR